MRYQERIYIQTPHSCIRNKDVINVTMSSEICEFINPTFGMVGADKIKSGTTINDDEIHIINENSIVDSTIGSTIALTFSFTGNTEYFNEDVSFNYTIYKYNRGTSVFTSPAIFDSGLIGYETFSGDSGFTDSILVNDLSVDGEYILKGSFTFGNCATFLDNNLNSFRLLGSEYGIYDSEFDYYFNVIREAATHTFSLTSNNISPLGALKVESYQLTEGNILSINGNWYGSPIVSLNGSTLSKGVLGSGDYTTLNNNQIIFNGTLKDTDLINVAYVSSGNPNGLISESFIVPNTISSGVSGGEGVDDIYFNITTGKYEIFMSAEPVEFNGVVLNINGSTLLNGGDYYQSSENPKKLILNGLLVTTDIINVTYNSYGTYVGMINTDNFDLSWDITPPPTNDNGEFIVYVATDRDFSNIIYSAETSYVVNVNSYELNVDLSGYNNIAAYYKVTNKKNYDTISGGTMTTISDSQTMEIEIVL